jgi:hypothetical protein
VLTLCILQALTLPFPWRPCVALQVSKPSTTYRKVFAALEEQANLAWHVLQVRWGRACAALSRELCTKRQHVWCQPVIHTALLGSSDESLRPCCLTS